MLGDTIAKFLVQVFGFLWPAYQCFKSIEHKEPTAIREWCIYWFTIAVFITAERFLDLFVFWLPLYHEAKLLFVIWLWHPRTKGAVYLYANTLQPVLSQHEAAIDQKLAELKAIFGDFVQSHSGSAVQFLKDKLQFLIGKAQAIQDKGPNGRAGGNGNGQFGAGGGGGQGHGGGAGRRTSWVGDVAAAAAERFSSGGDGSGPERRRSRPLY